MGRTFEWMMAEVTTEGKTASCVGFYSYGIMDGYPALCPPFPLCSLSVSPSLPHSLRLSLFLSVSPPLSFSRFLSRALRNPEILLTSLPSQPAGTR